MVEQRERRPAADAPAVRGADALGRAARAPVRPRGPGGIRSPRRSWDGRARTRSPGASTPRCTAAGCGRCGSSPGSARPPRPTSATASCSNAARAGLSVAFDMPTLMGRDSDDPLAEGEVGRCGVATDTLEDFDALFDGIPLGDISTSMTINGPAVVVFAFYLAAAERAGRRRRSGLDGTLQTDILKEYIAQKEWIFPPRPHLRLDRRPDGVLRRTRPALAPDQRLRVPHPRGRLDGARRSSRSRWPTGSPTSSSALAAGLDVDRVRAAACRSSSTRTSTSSRRSRSTAPRAGSGRGGCSDALRREATSPRMRLRFHTQTAGVSLTAQQPMNNVVRTAIEALAAVLGGTQSLHTNALDEVAGAADRGGRHAGAPHPADHRARDRRAPTSSTRSAARTSSRRSPTGWRSWPRPMFARIARDGRGLDARRGAHGDRAGVFQQAIAESAFREQERFERGDLVKVGVTDFVDAGSSRSRSSRSPAARRPTRSSGFAGSGERRDAAAARAALDRLGAGRHRRRTSSSPSSTAPGPCAPRARSSRRSEPSSARTPRRPGSGAARSSASSSCKSTQLPKLRQRCFMRSRLSGSDQEDHARAASQALGVGVIVSAFLLRVPPRHRLGPHRGDHRHHQLAGGAGPRP